MEALQPNPADALKLWLEGERIVIEFGTIMTPSTAADAPTVTATDRVVLPIGVGRRLVHSLEDALKPHAARLRAAEAQALSPGEAAAALRPDLASQQRADTAGDTAALLLRTVGGLGVPYAYERSFRIAQGTLSANRFLLTVDAKDLRDERATRPTEICAKFGMPDDLRAAAEAQLEMARCFHFGFEGESDGIICKLYLERRVPEGEADRAREAGEPVLLHLAFKWDIEGRSAVTTRYLWHQARSARQIEERLAQVYQDREPVSRQIAQETLRLAAERTPSERLQYLEVIEDENDRRSFDLNLYNAKLQIKEIQHLLYRMRDHFGIRPGQFQALYDQIKGKALGHIAGGLHRNGKDFFNIYYGVVGLPQFHNAFR